MCLFWVSKSLTCNFKGVTHRRQPKFSFFQPASRIERQTASFNLRSFSDTVPATGNFFLLLLWRSNLDENYSQKIYNISQQKIHRTAYSFVHQLNMTTMYQSIIYIIYNLNLKEIALLSIYVITEIEHYFPLTSNTCTKHPIAMVGDQLCKGTNFIYKRVYVKTTNQVSQFC